MSQVVQRYVCICVYVLIIPGLVEVRSVGSLTMSPVDQRAIVSNIVKTQDDPPGTWSPSVLAGPVPPVAQWQDRWWPGQCHTCGRAGSPCRPPAAGRAATVES